MNKKSLFTISISLISFCLANNINQADSISNGEINVKYLYSRGINFIPLCGYESYQKLFKSHINILDNILLKKNFIKNNLSPIAIYNLNTKLEKDKKEKKWIVTEKAFKRDDIKEEDFIALPLKYQPICPKLYEIPEPPRKKKSKKRGRINLTAREFYISQKRKEIASKYPKLKEKVELLYNHNIYFSKGIKYLLDELYYLNAPWHQISILYNKNIVHQLNLAIEAGLKYSLDSRLKKLNNNKKLILDLELKNPLIDLGNYCIFLSGKSGIKFEKNLSVDDTSLQFELSDPGIFKEGKFLQKASHSLMVGYVFDKGSNGYFKLGSSFAWDFSKNFKVLIQQYLRYPISTVKTITDDRGETSKIFLLRNDYIGINVLKVLNSCLVEFGVIFTRNVPRFHVWDSQYKDAVLFTSKLKDESILYHQWNKDLFTSVNLGFVCSVNFVI